MKARTFKIGGIHLPENKLTAGSRIVDVELPMMVSLSLKQHIGTPAKPIVAKGDAVVRGQKVAEASGKVSAAVHTPISGTVVDIKPVLNTAGLPDEAIIIQTTQELHYADEAARIETPVSYNYAQMSQAELIATIADAGVVGLGGATFPTAMKLSPPPGSVPKVLIINGVECEPYLTCDDALMRACPTEIVEGINIMLQASGTPRAVIGIEVNKPEAIAALEKACANYDYISVMPLQCKYPEGGEKQLIYAVTGLEVKSGALPISVGAIVQNVGTAYAVYKAVALRMPLIERVITVAGRGNYLVPIGMNIKDLPINEISAYSCADVIIGGPMMGRSAATLDAPVQKGTAGITILQPLDYAPQPCIRCGECVQACPMGLQPYLIATYGRLKRTDDALLAGAKDCIECGSCSYSCPSARPILDYIRLAKIYLRKS